MPASIDDAPLSPVSPLLTQLRAAVPSLQRRVPLQDEGNRWHRLRIGERSYRTALPVTFTPYASVRPCSARCGFCSENLSQHGGGLTASMLRPGPAYFDQLRAALQVLHAVPLSYSLSGLEMTDDAHWLQTLLQTLSQTPDGPQVEQRVLYSNGAGLARAQGRHLLDALSQFGLSWIELSRHHPLQARNDAIMRFRADEPIADASTFMRTARSIAERLPVRLVCIVQRDGICRAEDVAHYIAWARRCGASQVIFRELSRLDEAYRSNGTWRYIERQRIGVEPLLADCMQQPWWAQWQLDGMTEGYYFWNVRLRGDDGLQVVFESADYAAMHARHATGDIYKLVFFANGRLCAGWNPDADVLWEPADG
ncbi:hypothetical protein [Xanthomonas campestris]|uniref:hypothetical protein n=1 Tax=Xanthomonas campestris TaxID=339 RepID=UPI001E37F00F|nr:hypothetical protein [Xanthomonas campestris]MCC4602969.1 hypothetical protein [Xanthomonas campestris pv. parthenii]